MRKYSYLEHIFMSIFFPFTMERQFNSLITELSTKIENQNRLKLKQQIAEELKNERLNMEKTFFCNKVNSTKAIVSDEYNEVIFLVPNYDILQSPIQFDDEVEINSRKIEVVRCRFQETNTEHLKAIAARKFSERLIELGFVKITFNDTNYVEFSINIIH